MVPGSLSLSMALAIGWPEYLGESVMGHRREVLQTS